MLRDLDNIAPAEARWEGCPSHLTGADTRCLYLDILSLQVSCQSVNPRDPPVMAQEQEKPRYWGGGEMGRMLPNQGETTAGSRLGKVSSCRGPGVPAARE